MQTSTDPLILLDVDSLYFRVCFKTKKQNEIRKYIDKWLVEIEGDNLMGEMKIAIKGKGNWRKDYYPLYKANRPDLAEDMKGALTYAHNYLVDKHKAVRADGMEADDLVAIWASEAREMERQYVVAGIDKDLLQIPGNHYNFVKKEHQFVDDDTAHYKLMLQCLTGDNSDNIPGIKGIGPKKAERILSNIPANRRWNRIRAAWRGHNAGDPGISFRLLKMLTSFEELDDIKNEIASKTSECKPDVLQK